MAKKTLTLPSYDVDNNQQQPRKPTLDYVSFQTLLDKTGADNKDFQTNTHIPELTTETADTSGAHGIGFGSSQGDITSDNVGDALDEIVTIAKDAQAGTILDDSLTEAKMANEMKKQAGGVAKYNDLEVLRIAETDTGAADAYIVTTADTFSRVDGNILNFIPSNTNTGASTINEDSNGAANIEKYVDGAWVSLEADDLLKFQQASLVWNAAQMAFQLAPKTGGIKKIFHGRATLINASAAIVYPSTIDKDKSILITKSHPVTSTGNFEAKNASVRGLMQNDSQMSFYRGTTTDNAYASYELREYKNVKSRQEGNPSYSIANGSNTIDITISSVDVNKTVIAVDMATTTTSNNLLYGFDYYLLNATTIRVEIYAVGTIDNTIIHWQALEVA